MSIRAPIAGLGEIMQLAFIPGDMQKAVKFWTETMGVGPFFSLPHVKLENVRYLDRPVEVDFSMLLAYWGDIQIELIEQHNDSPSIYRSWREAGQEGLHHTCILVEDFEAARTTCLATGGRILQQGDVPGGGQVIYVETGGGPGTMLEVLKPSPGSRGLFAMMKQAAADWDGSNPIRSLG